MRKGSGIARFCFHCLSFSTSCAGARRPCASSPRMEINPELKIERLGQFLYLPRQALLVQHVHEGIGIKLLHIEHALAFPCAGQNHRCADHGRNASRIAHRSEEHTSEIQSLMRISYAVFCLKKKNIKAYYIQHPYT